MQIFRSLILIAIDRSDHWSLLLFKEALAIRRLKPELNHEELVIFN
jgi:hypothetical protein